MRVWIDGNNLIDEAVVSAGSIKRQVIERGCAGLDGLTSIDIGFRGREIVLDGLIRAASSEGLDDRLGDIFSLMDGSGHVLSAEDGRKFEHLRFDEIETQECVFGGSGISCKCKLKFTQLRMS